tara:strand:- start:44 stop:613 length:570 start_codon:yes stop_codon:yes gene_type:complete
LKGDVADAIAEERGGRTATLAVLSLPLRAYDLWLAVAAIPPGQITIEHKITEAVTNPSLVAAIIDAVRDHPRRTAVVTVPLVLFAAEHLMADAIAKQGLGLASPFTVRGLADTTLHHRGAITPVPAQRLTGKDSVTESVTHPACPRAAALAVLSQPLCALSRGTVATIPAGRLTVQLKVTEPVAVELSR